MRKYFIILFAAAAALSCSREMTIDVVPSGQAMRFKISDIDTRAYLTDGYRICWETGKDQVSVFAKTDNCRFTATTGGDGTFWLEGALSQATSIYYAVYPYSEDASNATGCITTTLPAEQKAVPNQFSNIVAVAATKTDELHFQNCVTLVEVSLATQGVNKISFRGNNGELIAGRIRMNVPSKPEESAPEPVIVEGVKEVSISDGGKELSPGKYYLAVTPQLFSKGITIRLSGENGSVEKTTVKPVTAGRSRRLVTGNLDLAPVPVDNDFSVSWSEGEESGTVYAGASKTLVYSHSGTNALKFKVNGSSAFSFSDPDYPNPGQEFTYRLKPVAGSGGTNANNNRLKAAGSRGSQASPVDLSTDNNNLFSLSLGGVNTANCYVVRTPGWYSFPLVYGNGIRHSSPNPTAYAPSVSGASVLSPFVRADGSGITSPYINADGSVAVSARIEWQDEPGLVADGVALVKSGGSGDKIVFNVPSETIREGNAVISALDASGNVVWSWHIWVCGASDDELMPVGISASPTNNHLLLKLNLGWVAAYDSPLVYEPRETTLIFTQNGSGKTVEFKLQQTGASYSNIMGNCPFYQWGRKDPFVASDGTPSDDPMAECIKKTWYTTSGRDTTGTRGMRLGTSLAAYIRHPSHYNKDSNGDNTYSNLWHAKQDAFYSTNTHTFNTQAVVKTVYDPCPVGACLPPVGAFAICTTDNISGVFNLGYAFFTAPGKSGGPLFFPATGSMSTMNLTSTRVVASLGKVGTGFSYWAANANRNSAGFNLNCYNKGAPTSSNGSNRQYVFPIRPCIEE